MSLIKFIPDVPAFVKDDGTLMESIANNDKAVKVIANFLAQCSGRTDVYARIAGKEREMYGGSAIHITLPEGKYAKLQKRATTGGEYTNNTGDITYANDFYMRYDSTTGKWEAALSQNDFSYGGMGTSMYAPVFKKYNNGYYGSMSSANDGDVELTDQYSSPISVSVKVNEFGIVDVVNMSESTFTNTVYQKSLAFTLYNDDMGTNGEAASLWETGDVLTAEY